MNGPMARRPEPAPSITPTLVFAAILAVGLIWALVTGVLAIGGPA